MSNPYFSPLNKNSRSASSANSVRPTPRFSPGLGLTAGISYLGQLYVWPGPWWCDVAGCVWAPFERAGMAKLTIYIATTSACVKHFADCPAIYRHWSWTLPWPDMIRWGAGVVAGGSWGKLHCMQMWDVSSPPKVMTGLQLPVLPVIKIDWHILILLS